jgi:hypothetical protein
MNNQKTHWLQSPNKNYFGHWDFPDEKDLILTIASAKWEEVENPILKKGDPKKFEAHKVIRFVEDYKPLICNQTNALSIIKSTGIKYMEDSTGQKIQLYVGIHFDRVAKENIDCVRIRNTPIKEKPILIKGSTDFNNVAKALKNGYTIEDAKVKFNISQEVEIQLLEI